MYADLRSQWIVLTCLASLFDRPGGRLVAELSMVVELCENAYMGGSGNMAFVAVRPKL